MTDALLGEYSRLHCEVLVPVAAQLEGILRGHLGPMKRVDRISVRPKSPGSFVTKARRLDAAGLAKYSAPLTQIQDQVGARVIVFYLSDIEPIGAQLLKYFRHIEARAVVPESEWEFGYFGHHYVLALPGEAVPPEIPRAAAPRVFELQVKTLFQHAWSEAEHDLGYKAPTGLSSDQRRRLAFTAAQAWGADRVFCELWNELSRDGGPV